MYHQHIIFVELCLCLLVSANPAYQRIPVWVYPPNGCPYNQGRSSRQPGPQTIPWPNKQSLEMIKTDVAPDIVDEILVNPVLSALLSPKPNALKKREPNIVNNYIIVPPEFLNINDTISKVISQNNGMKKNKSRSKNSNQVSTNKKNIRKTNTPRQTRQRTSQYRNNNNFDDNRRHYARNNYLYPNNYNTYSHPHSAKMRNIQQPLGRPNNVPSQRRPYQQQRRNKLKTTKKNKTFSQLKDTRKEPTTQRNVYLNDLKVELDQDLGNIYDPKPKQRHCQDIDDIDCIQTSHEKNKEDLNSKSLQTSYSKPSNERKIKQRIIKNENEALIQAFLKKFPDLPEEVIRGVVHDVKKQLFQHFVRSHSQQPLKDKHQQKQQSRQHDRSNIQNKKLTPVNKVWHPPYYSTKPFETKKSKDNPTDQVINTLKKENSKEETNVVPKETLSKIEHEINDSDNNGAEEKATTEEFTLLDNINSFGDSSARFQSVNENIDVEKTQGSSTEHNDGYKEYNFPQLGTEDVVLPVPNLIDDYFPEFKIDNKAHSLKDEDIYENDYFDEEFQREQRKISENNANKVSFESKSEKYKAIPLHNVVSEILDATSESYSEETSTESYELHYQTPPALDTPNFLSRRINPKILNTEDFTINTDDYHFKNFNEAVTETLEKFAKVASVYSKVEDVKSILNEIEKEHLMDYNKHNKDIETVYAGSKVVNYGRGSVKENSKTVYDETTEATVVFAKSYPEDDFW